MSIHKHTFLHLLPLVGLFALAGCEAGSGDGDDSTTQGATSAPGETDAPTTGDAQTEASGGQTDETGAPTSAGDTTDSSGSGDDTGASTTDEGTTGEPAIEPEIAGSYTDEYGSMHTIGAQAWNLDTSVFHVLAVDNDTDHLIARNDAANDFSPDLYSRFDWHVEGQDIHYCQTSYDAASQEAAEATEPADGADLLMGCSGFPWTLLTP